MKNYGKNRPILRGRDIKRYDVQYADLWLINMHNGLKNSEIQPLDINDYPAIKEHLDIFYDRLAKRADKGVTPYNLRNCAYMNDFSQQKIMYNDICQRLSFSLVPENVFCVNTVYFIKNNKHLLYLLGCLNSNLIDWYYRTLSVQLGNKAVRMFSIYVENIPIPKLSEVQENIIVELINKLLMTKDLELRNEIDSKLENIILDLYQLNDNEKEYIKSKYNRTIH